MSMLTNGGNDNVKGYKPQRWQSVTLSTLHAGKQVNAQKRRRWFVSTMTNVNSDKY